MPIPDRLECGSGSTADRDGECVPMAQYVGTPYGKHYCNLAVTYHHDTASDEALSRPLRHRHAGAHRCEYCRESFT